MQYHAEHLEAANAEPAIEDMTADEVDAEIKELLAAA